MQMKIISQFNPNQQNKIDNAILYKKGEMSVFIF